MKILFISQGGLSCDYLRDMALHGLKSLFGPDVVDVGKVESLYRGVDTSQLYGKGFTLYGLLPDLPCDRTEIPAKIAAKYFDLVIYGSIHRCQDYLHEVAAKYHAPQVIFLDGEDHPGYLSGLAGVTFKRELYNAQPGCLPIQFAIPKEKILKEQPMKHRLIAPCDPIDRKTYIYNDEEGYYAQYASSYYAATMRKAGFDCLRHYEILANWCLPYFRAFESLAQFPFICHKLPRRELMLIKNAYEYFKGTSHSDTLKSLYWDMIGPLMTVLCQDLTTEALATYILDKVEVATKVLV